MEPPLVPLAFHSSKRYTPCVEQERLRILGEKLMDAANLGFGGLVVGQIIAKEFRMDWTLWGLGIWVGF